MKNLYTLFLFVLPLLLWAQTYEFSFRQGTYQDLENSISLNNGEVWDDPTYAVPLGFSFRFFDQESDTMFLDGENVSVGAILSSFNAPTILQLLVANGADLIDRGYLADTSLSNISYLLEGDAGSRIFKLEWSNAGFFSELFENDISEDFTNFQLWLYEEDDAIEVHFGPKSIGSPELSYDDLAGTFVGLIDSFNIDEDIISFSEGYFLEGDPLNPNFREITPLDLDNDPITLSGDIPNGTIYRFERRTSKVSEIEQTYFTVVPNPVKDVITVEWPRELAAATDIQLLNISGQIIKNWIQVQNNSILNFSNLTPGVYILRMPELTESTQLIYKE